LNLGRSSCEAKIDFVRSVNFFKIKAGSPGKEFWEKVKAPAKNPKPARLQKPFYYTLE